MKRILTVAGLFVSLACAFFFFRSVAHHWSALNQVNWNHRVWSSLTLALAIYISTYALVSFAWGRSLKALGHPLRYHTTLRIMLLSQFAKYLPGNVGHHVGRILLAKREGLPTETVLGGMLLDTLIVLAAACACSLPTLHLLIQVASQQSATHAHATASLIAVGFAFVVGVFLLFPSIRRALVHQLRHITHLIRREKLPLLGMAWVTHCASFLAGGTALHMLCIAFTPGIHAQHWIEVTGIYASAWLLGFLMPGAPAGLGVREVVLLLGLSPLIGTEPATAAAATLRLVTTLGDGLAFTLGLALHPRQRKVTQNLDIHSS